MLQDILAYKLHWHKWVSQTLQSGLTQLKWINVIRIWAQKIMLVNQIRQIICELFLINQIFANILFYGCLIQIHWLTKLKLNYLFFTLILMDNISKLIQDIGKTFVWVWVATTTARSWISNQLKLLVFQGLSRFYWNFAII